MASKLRRFIQCCEGYNDLRNLKSTVVTRTSLLKGEDGAAQHGVGIRRERVLVDKSVATKVIVN